ISDKFESSTAEILSVMNINNGQSNVELLTKIEEILQYVRSQSSKEKKERQEIMQQQLIQSLKLGQSVFSFLHQTNLILAVGSCILDAVMMDDGKLVICLPIQCRLVIYNTDGSQEDSIAVQGKPWYVTAINNCTVAFTLYNSSSIEMYDIHNKFKLKSITVPGMLQYNSDITTINNKLVVRVGKMLHVINHQTGEMVQTIKTDCHPWRLHGFSDRIFFCDSYFDNNNLYWYSYAGDRHYTLTLPSPPGSMTTLQDDSLYVVCNDRSIQHVSSDGKQYKPVKTLQSTSLCNGIHYNPTQRKLMTIQNKHVTVFNEV
ncbi:Hypothetical predicted protein, partial [Mytilus galloprovincialis]